MAAIAFVLGSDSDLPQLEGAFEILRSLEVGFAVRILSAHRTPHETAAFAEAAAAEGTKVLIGAAGMSAALPGVLAAHSQLPVIGIPCGGGALGGLDALYSTTQMPGGVPVASMGIGSAGAKNAALHAVRILSLLDSDLASRLAGYVDAQSKKVLEKDANVRSRYESS